jgi:uncharacterized protein YndB with AHSA1/START domain
LLSLLLLLRPVFAEDGDVVALRRIAASPEQAYAQVLDLSSHPQLWPEGCVDRWEQGSQASGVGASARLRYRAGAWRRSLTAIIQKADPPRRIDVEHPGRKGFVTTWTFTPAAGGVEVELHTWILAPPRPFKRAWERRIRPAWQRCHEGALEGLERALTSTP